MKHLITVALLLTCFISQSQFIESPYDSGYSYSRFDAVNLKSKRDARQVGIMSALMFTSGAARGMEQVLVYHWTSFHDRHQSADPQFWNPRYSWSNKYLHHDPNNGAKFPFSTTGLVWLTDGKHLFDMLNSVPIYVCITIPIAYPSHKQHLTRNVIGRAAMLALYRQAGFYLTYNVIY